MDNNKIALIYGFDEQEMESISNFAEESHFPFIKIIKNTMGNMKISEILSGTELEVYNSSLPLEKVILFSNFNDDELNKAIQNIRQKFKPMPILAVVTETSMKWTFEKLLNHLIEEREWVRLHNR